MIVTVTLTASFAGTEHLVLSLDWFVDDVVHVIVDLVIGGVHSLHNFWEPEYTCINKTGLKVKKCICVIC